MLDPSRIRSNFAHQQKGRACSTPTQPVSPLWRLFARRSFGLTQPAQATRPPRPATPRSSQHATSRPVDAGTRRPSATRTRTVAAALVPSLVSVPPARSTPVRHGGTRGDLRQRRGIAMSPRSKRASSASAPPWRRRWHRGSTTAAAVNASRHVPVIVRPVAAPIVTRIARESMVRTLEALRRYALN